MTLHLFLVDLLHVLVVVLLLELSGVYRKFVEVNNRGARARVKERERRRARTYRKVREPGLKRVINTTLSNKLLILPHFKIQCRTARLIITRFN